VAASIRSIRDALDVRLGSLDGKVSHFERETVALGRRGLAKGDFAPEGGFDSEAPSGANVLCNEVLALLDRLRSNLARDISVRAQIKFRGSVIDIERIHPALSDARIEDLARKSGEGTLSDSEREEYEALVSAGTFIAILQSKARRLLKDRPA